MPLKKVLHVCPYLHPRAGGPATLVPVYTRLLPDYGWRASILTTDWYSPGGSEEIGRMFHGLDVTVLETGADRLKVLYRDRYRAAQNVFQKADVIHVHGLWHPLGWMVRRYALAHKKPYLVSPHGMLDPWSMRQGKLKKTVYYRLFEKTNLQNAASIIFTTEAERDHIRPAMLNNPRQEVVLLGSDDPPDASRQVLRDDFLARFPVLIERKIVLFFGRLHAKKGLHEIVKMLPQVLGRVPDARLLIVGDGDTAYVNAIKQELKSKDLDHKVIFTGFLDGDDKWGALAASALMVLPSRQENFALAVAEAMKVGVPVLISDQVDIWPYIKKANAGVILNMEYMNKWTDTIIELLLDDKKRRTMGANAMRMAHELFSWEVSTQKLAQVYNSLSAE